MKKGNVFTRALTLTLAGSMLLTGCGGASKTAETKAAQEAVDSDGRKMEGNLYTEGLPIVKEQETFTIAVIGHPLAKGTYEDKPCVIQAEKDTNIKIKWMEIPSTGWQEKINVMFASGELPDAIATGITDSSIVKNLPQLVPIGDYIDKYAPHVAETYNKYPDLKTMLKQDDGKIYSFMTNSQTSRNDSTSGVLFINKQWLDNLGLPVPATVDEYYAALKAFKEQDPNGNGANDEIPFSFCQQYYASQFKMMMGAFGIKDDTDHIMIENGKVELSAAKPQYYDALKYYHKLASEGLLDVEGFSQTQQQYYSKGQQMVVGSFLEYLPYYVVGQENDSQYIPLAPLKSDSGEPLWDGIKDKFAGWHNGFVITKACKNPEALVRWFDYCNTSFTTKMQWFNGDRGVLWEMDDETGEWWNVNNYPEGQTKGEYRYTMSAGPHAPIFLTKDDWDKFVQKDDPQAEERKDCINLLEPYFPKDYILPVFEKTAVVEEKENLRVDIDNYIKNFTAQAVLSDIDDAGWKEHLAKLEKLNTARYLELQQQTYDNTNAN